MAVAVRHLPYYDRERLSGTIASLIVRRPTRNDCLVRTRDFALTMVIPLEGSS